LLVDILKILAMILTMKSKLLVDLSMLTMETVRAIEELMLNELASMRETGDIASKSHNQLTVELEKLEAYLDV